jgi:hypothetical protein
MTMSSEALKRLLDAPFHVTARREPIAGDLRLEWGLATTALILSKSRGQRASLQKIHFLAHSIRTKASQRHATGMFDGRLRSHELVVRVDPWVNRALAFAHGLGLVTLDGGKAAKLTSKGITYARQIAQADVLADEKRFLNSVADRATEGAVTKIMRMESLF